MSATTLGADEAIVLTPEPGAVAAAARAAHAAGLCVVPIRANGTKVPAVLWKKYQKDRPTDDDIEAWFGNDARQGLGLVCGAVSGNLELLEFEGAAVDEGYVDDFIDQAEAVGLGEVVARVFAGYTEESPSGGIHLLYRVSGNAKGNKALAFRPPTPEELAENPEQSDRLMIETRGEGGFVVVAPSWGRTHHNGKAYRLLEGGFDTIATITEEERDGLWDIARSFDERTTPSSSPPTPPRPTLSAPARPSSGFASVDEKLSERFDREHTCHDIFERLGWSHHHTDPNGDVHYTRPGKDPKDGSSATVFADEGTATVFSTSVPAVEDLAHKKMSPWRLSAHLEHDGDFTAWAQANSTTGSSSAMTAAPDPEVWDEPIELEGAKPPPFPLEAVPEVIADLARAFAESSGAAPDICAAIALVVAATATRGRVVVRPNGTGGSWSEQCILHVVPIALPGGMKSPASTFATKPLHKIEVEWRAEHAAVVARAASDRRIDEAKLKELESIASGKKGKGNPIEAAREAGDLAAYIAANPLPVIPELRVNDATPEALERMLAEQGAIGWLSDEGGALGKQLAGGYSTNGNANIDVFLKGHDAGTIKTRRVGRDPVTIERACLNIGVTIQPSVFEKIVADPNSAGRGVTERWCIIQPDLAVVDRFLRRTYDTGPAEAAWDRAVRAVVNEIREIREITLEPDADDHLRDFFAETKERRDPGGDLAAIPGWADKLDGRAVRLAGICALVEDPRATTIDLVAAQRGVALARYFADHALYAFGEVGVVEKLAHARKCLEVIRNGQPGEVVNQREVYKKVRGTTGLKEMDATAAAFGVLFHHGWIRPAPSEPSPKGGRPRGDFEVNPRLWP